MNALGELIRQEIRTLGPMRFDRFMEVALYHPEHGYYARPRRIGRSGDFFTSVSVGPLFGRMLTWQARQMAGLLAEPEFWIVEQGAHDGRLACDILKEARRWPDFAGRLRYLIVEPSPSHREAQEKMLAGFVERVQWVEVLANAKDEKPCGLFLSNELADALPVRLIEAKDGAWRERCVGLAEKDELTWALAEPDAELRAAIDALPLAPTDGFRTEIGLAARRWMMDAGAFLRRGYVVTIDYGFSASAYYAPFRRDGTLTCYHDHRRSDNVLDNPGRQDITAHVDFTALARAGERAGLETLALVDQQRFLTGILGAQGGPDDLGGETKAFQALTHPEHLGARFQVLAQAKDAPRSLSGLAFARPGGFD